jgi:hypothetical protein
MNGYQQFLLAATLLIALLGVLVLGAESAAPAAPLPPCEMRLRIELSPEVPNPRDAGFLSSLLGNHPDYRLTLGEPDAESASDLTLDLTGPGPDRGCREVVDSMRKDARVVSVEVERDAFTTAPPASSAQPMGTVRAGPDGDWVIEPLNAVSYAQQARDRYECDIWAADQTGFDPTQDDGGEPPDRLTAKHKDYLRAEGVCFQAHGYVVR